jgi:2-keto-4-pentenoate hydratase/2-oxohepta-3-ene-1,7-dioic acid hydratase in catechol pathway
MVVIDHKNAPALLQQMKYVVFNDITARDIQGAEMKSGVFSRSKSIKSRQVSHTGRMSVTIPEIISHYSAMGYSAGDTVSTGTVARVAGFGVLRNRVVAWADVHARA